MRDPDCFVDAHYTDRDGHKLIPGSWAHLIIPGSDHLSACQVLHYERHGMAWGCIIATPGGEKLELFGRQCAQSVVRLAEPLHPGTLEWAVVENVLRDGRGAERACPSPQKPLEPSQY